MNSGEDSRAAMTSSGDTEGGGCGNIGAVISQMGVMKRGSVWLSKSSDPQGKEDVVNGGVL